MSCTPLDPAVGVVEHPDQGFDSRGPDRGDRSPLFFCNQVADGLLLGLRFPADPVKDLRSTQPDHVALVVEGFSEKRCNRLPDAGEGIDCPKPDGVAGVVQRPYESGCGRLSKGGENPEGPLPDTGVVVPERCDERINGGLAYRLQDRGNCIAGIRIRKGLDERSRGGLADPDKHSCGRPADLRPVQGFDQRIHC